MRSEWDRDHDTSIFADAQLSDLAKAKTILPGVQLAEPLLVTAKQAARMCGKSVRTWRAWQSGGMIPPPVRVGRSFLWRVRDLEAWADAGCPQRDIFDSMSERRLSHEW